MQVIAPKRWYFDLAWDQLRAVGEVDSRGGREYVRVLKGWFEDGAPCEGLLDYIVTAANIGAQDYTGPAKGGN